MLSGRRPRWPFILVVQLTPETAFPNVGLNVSCAAQRTDEVWVAGWGGGARDADQK